MIYYQEWLTSDTEALEKFLHCIKDQWYMEQLPLLKLIIKGTGVFFDTFIF